jgi:hypothetical protein
VCVELQGLSLKKQVLAAQLQNTDSFYLNGDTTTAQAMQEYLENDVVMWMNAKATQFYKNLCSNKQHSTPLPLRDWLRLLLQVDTSLSISEMMRIFDEQDSVTAMSAARSHFFHSMLCLTHMSLASSVTHEFCP